jgi:hypothetical protein
MDEQNPIAPGQHAGAESPNNPGEANQEQQSGFQQRIDQLTARMREQERQFQSQLESERTAREQLMMSVLSGQRQQPSQQEELPDMDPSERARFDAMLKPFMQQNQQLSRQVQSLMAGQQVQQAAAKFGAVDPAVLQSAAQLAQNWTAGGYSGWKPEDAVVYAMGQAAMQARQNPQRNQQGQFTAAPDVMMGQAAPPASARPRAKIPDFTNASPEQILAAFEKSGMDDMPL